MDIAHFNQIINGLRSKIKQEWKQTWNEYPYHKRSPEDREAVNDAQIRIIGYIEALDNIQDILKEQHNDHNT